MARKIVLKDIDVGEKDRRRTTVRVYSGSRMVDWDAPGMPPPGPNFLEFAQRFEDGTEEISESVVDEKTGRKKKVSRFSWGDKLIESYHSAMTTTRFEMPVEVKAGIRKNVQFLPGHVWSQNKEAFVSGSDISVGGPRPAEVMVITKLPTEEDLRKGRQFSSEAGRLFMEMLQEIKAHKFGNWYVTSLLKFSPPDGGSRIKASWLKDCLPILQQELRIVRPKYILCLGADVSKAMLGKQMSITRMDGRVMDYKFPLNQRSASLESSLIWHTSLAMAVTHPSSVLRDVSEKRKLSRGLSRFNQLVQGKRFDSDEKDIDHRKISTLEDLIDYLFEIENDPDKVDNLIGTDAEWHGEHPCNAGSYIRTIQISHKPKSGAAFVLHEAGGKPCFVDSAGKPAMKRAMKLLSKYFKGGTIKLRNGAKLVCRKKRVVGHFFNSDLEWLVAAGLDLRDEFSVPLYDENFDEQDKDIQDSLKKFGYGPGDEVPAFVLSRFVGGIDTGMLAHSIEETASFGLEGLLMRYTDVPRYDVALQDWKKQYCDSRGLKAKDLQGYGEVPDDVLVPYGIYDSDGTLRLYYELEKLWDSDYEGNNCWEPFWESMIAAPAVLDIHRNGILVDKTRVDDLTSVFMEGRSQLEEKIKSWSNWPSFNIRSVQQVKEFLFGEEYNGKVTPDGGVVRIRPVAGSTGPNLDGEDVVYTEDAKTLRVQPFQDTSVPPKKWSDIVDRGKEREHSPSTGKSVLAILAQDNPQYAEQINWIRDYRFIDQVLKSLLRPPVETDDGAWLSEHMITDSSVVDFSRTSFGSGLGGFVYDAGLASLLCDDGRVRTHIYQTLDTGRWSSSRPNLQNISKSRDPDYVRILGDGYKHKLRSILIPSPGHVFVEADYTGAELFGMSVMSGDETMIDHCRRNQLAEDDPEFHDIHSHVAKLAFNLDCEPTKSGLKSIGKVHIRVIAKSVIFGIAYGRGAKAIAVAAKEQGVHVTVEETQQVIDSLFDMYPGLQPFFAECRTRALEHGWMQNCFGRYRRFPSTTDNKTASEFERKAMNFPIQSLVASVMSRAMAYIHDYKTRVEPDLYRIVLQIHDAVLLEVPYENVVRVVDHVLPLTMREMVPIYPSRLNGMPTGSGPYKLGIDCDVMYHWGEQLTEDFCQQNGIPLVSPGGLKIAS